MKFTIAPADLTMLLKSAYTGEQFQYMLAQAGFGNVDIQADGLSMTKSKPPATSH